MIKVIVSGGCSMAYGFNLLDRDKKYASLLADHCGAELIDVSCAGASNENIAAAVAYGINQALTKADPSEILVVVGWTEIDRIEYWNKSLIRLHTIFVNRSQHLNGDQDQNSAHTRVRDWIVNHMWEPCYGYYKLVHAFNYIHNLCEMHKLRIIHLQNVEVVKVRMPNRRLVNASIRQEQYTDGVFSTSTEKAFEDMYHGSSFLNFVLTEERLRLQPGIDDHPSELGHKQWFDKILKKYAKVLQ